jgi:small subunit ribosomal protein S6
MYAREYELIYIVRPDSPDEDLQTIVDRTTGLIDKAEGTLLQVDVWGKRKLAYEIQKFNKGHYTLVRFLSEPEVVAEIERLLRIDDTILRYQTVKCSDRVHVESRITEYADEVAAAAARAASEPDHSRDLDLL